METLPFGENRTSDATVSVAGATDVHSAPVSREQLDHAPPAGPQSDPGSSMFIPVLHRGRGVRMKTRPKRMTSVVPTSERVVS